MDALSYIRKCAGRYITHRTRSSKYEVKNKKKEEDGQDLGFLFPSPTTAADVRLHGHLSCWAADISPHDEIDFLFHLSLRRLSTYQLGHRMAL
jgi:hypothetical protein